MIGGGDAVIGGEEIGIGVESDSGENTEDHRQSVGILFMAVPSKRMKRPRALRRPQFRVADIAQQSVGGFLLAGPFVVTEEVWVLADGMNWIQGAATAALVGLIGYAALYRADTGRDVDDEPDLIGIPARFVSLMFVAFGSVLLLAMLFDAPETFLVEGGIGGGAVWATMAKAVSLGAVFSVVGAATADSVF